MLQNLPLGLIWRASGSPSGRKNALMAVNPTFLNQPSRFFRGNAESDQGAHVSEDRLSDGFGELLYILMREH